MGDDAHPKPDWVLLDYWKYRSDAAAARTPAERKRVNDARASVFKPVALPDPNDLTGIDDAATCRCSIFVTDSVQDFSKLSLTPLLSALKVFDKYGLKLEVSEDWSSGKPKFDLNITGNVPLNLTVPPED